VQVKALVQLISGCVVEMNQHLTCLSIQPTFRTLISDSKQ